MKKTAVLLTLLALMPAIPDIKAADSACYKTLYLTGSALDDGTGNYGTLKDGTISFIARGARVNVAPSSVVKIESCGDKGAVLVLTKGRLWINSSAADVSINVSGGVLAVINGAVEVTTSGARVLSGRAVYSKDGRKTTAGAGYSVDFRTRKILEKAQCCDSWQEANKKLAGVTVFVEKDFDGAYDTAVVSAVKGALSAGYGITAVSTFMDTKKPEADLNFKIRIGSGNGTVTCKAVLINRTAGDVVALIEKTTVCGPGASIEQAVRKTVSEASAEAAVRAGEYVSGLLRNGTKIAVEAEGLRPEEFKDIAGFLSDLSGVTGFSASEYYGQKRVYIFNYSGCGDDLAAILADKKSYINIWKYSKNIVKLSNKK
ncbi:MAG: hypothetical protein LLG37_10230 [Spirochaetia bacterium]|nr:hypothetical protein [Spirochaetia bacterium]